MVNKNTFTKDQLLKQMAILKKKVVSLEKERKEKNAVKYDLGERVKELKCLYELSRLAEDSSISIESFLQKVVSLIPPAWQYPTITCARIVLDESEFRTKKFKVTKWVQSAVIKCRHEAIGRIDVFYLQKKNAREEGPFLKEERSLLNVMAEHLGDIIERRLAEDDLYKKNIALREILVQLEQEKKHLKTAVEANVDSILLPALTRLKKKGLATHGKYYDLFEQNLKALTAPFGVKISDRKLKLTPREIEICNLIKSGLTMKEISEILNISIFSVGTHRRNIRRKLGLTCQKVNLPVYLNHHF